MCKKKKNCSKEEKMKNINILCTTTSANPFPDFSLIPHKNQYDKKIIAK